MPIDARDVPCGRYGVHDPRGGRLLPPLNSTLLRYEQLGSGRRERMVPGALIFKDFFGVSTP